MLNKDACKLLRSKPYKIVDSRDRFHNPCADSLEGLIGALFIHLSSNGLNHVIYIRDWLLKNTNFVFFLRSYLTNVGTNASKIYTLPDRESLMKQVAERKLNLLSHLEDLRETLGDELYFSLREAIKDESTNSNSNEFAIKSIIVEPTTPISDIYRILGWKYEQPAYYPEYESYLLMGYPGGEEKTIGWGETKEEANEDGRNYLLLMGYIINMKPLSRFFTR